MKRIQKATGLIKTQKGFTLLELLLVVAIIGVLVSIVAPALSDSRSAGTEGQVEADASALDTSQKSFNNKSTTNKKWPEQAFGTLYKDPVGGDRKYLDLLGNVITGEISNAQNPTGIDHTGLTGFEFNHTEIKMDAKTTVWLDDGSVATLTFMPDFLSKLPQSGILKNDEGLVDVNGNPLFEFLWLLRVNSPGTESESRRTEVYRLVKVEGTTTSPLAVYQQVF